MERAITEFPRCAAYLKGMFCRMDDKTMSLYWWAVILVGPFRDDELAAYGGIDFNTMTGEQLLSRMEQFLGDRRKIDWRMGDGVQSLLATVGAYGVKTSGIRNATELIEVSVFLFGVDEGTPEQVLHAVKALPKKERSRRARGNFRRLAHFSDAENPDATQSQMRTAA